MSALISASANRNVWPTWTLHTGGSVIDSQLVRNRGEHGAGLGLSTARWIVDQHQGCYSKCSNRRTRDVKCRPFMPQHVAMMIYSDPDNQRLQEEAKYVERYVRRHM